MEITRNLAIRFLILKDFFNLSKVEKLEIYENELQHDKKDRLDFDEDLLEYLKISFKGVTNEYISNEIFKLISIELIIVGASEILNKCPCCNYKTLEERGIYDVCKICFWEDDSILNENSRFSTTNKTTIEEYRMKFNLINYDKSKYYL
jgi:Cysteine-rich CPCC